MAGVKTGRATAGTFPYNPAKKLRGRLKGHEKNKEKVRGIAQTASRANAEYMATYDKVFNTIPEDQRTNRNADGSFYLLGNINPVWPIRK